MEINQSAIQQLSDFDVLDRILAGEPGLYEILIRRYNPTLYKVGRSYGFPHEDVQDLMQDAYISAYQYLSQFERKSQFSTWLVRIMINKCLYKMKKERASEPVETIVETGNTATPEKKVLQHELGKILEKAIEDLPEHYRLVFVLREKQGFSVAETAEILDLSQVNVKVRMNRARTILKENLEKWYSLADIYDFHLRHCTAVVNNVLQAI
jgi:RNA polymerase sigma factor (sigma-70 family)